MRLPLPGSATRSGRRKITTEIQMCLNVQLVHSSKPHNGTRIRIDGRSKGRRTTPITIGREGAHRDTRRRSDRCVRARRQCPTCHHSAFKCSCQLFGDSLAVSAYLWRSAWISVLVFMLPCNSDVHCAQCILHMQTRQCVEEHANRPVSRMQGSALPYNSAPGGV